MTPKEHIGKEAIINNQNPLIVELNTETGFNDQTKQKIKALKTFEITKATQLQKDYLLPKVAKPKEINNVVEAMVKYLYANYDFKTIVSEETKELWVKIDHVYEPVAKAVIIAFTRDICGKKYKESLANQVMTRIYADNLIKSSNFFRGITLDTVIVNNGVLNLKTRELTNDSTNQIHFNKHPIKYDKNATCPNIEKFFKTILEAENDVQTMYELIGYTLYKDSFIEKGVMFKGKTRNGKSKTLDLILNLLGNENISKVSLQRVVNDKTALCMFQNKNANLCGDISGAPLKDVNQVKELIGRDNLTAFRKFKDDIGFKPYAKLIFSTNHLPALEQNDTGFWTKWVLIDFPHTFISAEELLEKDKLLKDGKITQSERNKYKLKDPFIINKLITPEELSGLLNKALDGLDSILKKNDFTKNQSAKTIERIWSRESNSLVAFIEDNLENVSDSYISPEDLRIKYKEYCDLNDKTEEYRSISKTMHTFGNSLCVGRRYSPDEPFGEKHSDIPIAKYWSNIKFKKEKKSIPSYQKAKGQSSFSATSNMSLSKPYTFEEETETGDSNE